MYTVHHDLTKTR